MFISIRYRFLLAFTITSIVSIMLVVGIAYFRLLKKFDAIVLQHALESFQSDVVSYIHTYGSWEEAVRKEDFPSFTDRRRQKMGLPVFKGLNSTTPIEIDRNIEMDPMSVFTPSLPAENLRRPPFRFYLFDTGWRALLPLEPYKVGDPMQTGLHSEILPIISDGKTLAYFSPEGHITYSDFDLGYLAAMRESMIYGTVAAAFLTLVLSLIFSNQLSEALRVLTTAMQAIEEGELKQHVVITSRDEIGMLANSFNSMSDELARSHEELRQTHELILNQAEQLKELSLHDSLTQLHNRRFLEEHAAVFFQQAVSYKRPFTVMIGDIDFFKRINDNFSHAMGDEVLRRVSGILRSQVRTTDIVIRYGGEEFVIAFPDMQEHHAVVVCEKLRRSIEEYSWHELHPDLKVTISIGLSGDIHSGSLESMLKIADTMLYEAKSLGRNRVCFKREPKKT